MKTGPTEVFWGYAGLALLFFALLFGMGSCGALLNLSQAHAAPQERMEGWGR